MSSSPSPKDQESFGQIFLEAFPVHPFDRPIEIDQFEALLAEYLGMSVAFPYLQAGALFNIIEKHIATGTDVTLDDEVTLYVAAFLAFDETGGNSLLVREGMGGLPKGLNTRGHFHSAMLRSDLTDMVGHAIRPSFSPFTRDYLAALSAGLSSENPMVRTAMMTSFEAHAERMITALWARLAEVYPTERAELSYFSTHVGGDDPAEAYHVETTHGMIARTVPMERMAQFLDLATETYGLHVRWCGAIRQDR